MIDQWRHQAHVWTRVLAPPSNHHGSSEGGSGPLGAPPQPPSPTLLWECGVKKGRKKCFKPLVRRPTTNIFRVTLRPPPALPTNRERLFNSPHFATLSNLPHVSEPQFLHLYRPTIYTWVSIKLREFPGSPVVRTPRFHCQGPGIQPLVKELRTHKPYGTAKNIIRLRWMVKRA